MKEKEEEENMRKMATCRTGSMTPVKRRLSWTFGFAAAKNEVSTSVSNIELTALILQCIRDSIKESDLRIHSVSFEKDWYYIALH